MKLWNHPETPLILASQSPRRKQILSQMGLTFSVVIPQGIYEAEHIDDSDLSGSLQKLALTKARSVAVANPDALVLGADTIVVLDKHILGKPLDRDDAKRMLIMLCGHTHQVLTAVSLVHMKKNFLLTSIQSTDVRFRIASAEEIDAYLETGEYQDKAGSYGIQGSALIFVDSIDGCYYNVVGLPVSETIGLFKAFAARKD